MNIGLTRRMLCCWTAATLLFPATASAVPTERPNVVILYADDLGYGEEKKMYEICEAQPAPNSGPDWDKVVSRGMPFDKDWERWSYPIGNGYMGANLFGRVDTERIQITEKALHNKGCHKNGGATSFAELYLDFNHGKVQNYGRSLNVSEAIAYVSYEKDGVTYKRAYFTSYPNNVMAVRLTADKKGALSFVVRPDITYLEKEQRTGTITAQGDLLTLAGTMAFFNCNYEGQIKVINQGGAVIADDWMPGRVASGHPASRQKIREKET